MTDREIKEEVFDPKRSIQRAKEQLRLSKGLPPLAMSEHEEHDRGVTKEHEILHRILCVLEKIEKNQHQTERHIVAAIDNLTAAVTGLSTGVTALTLAVDTAVIDIGSPVATEAAIQVQADAITALTAAVASQSGRLNTATGGVTPPVPGA